MPGSFPALRTTVWGWLGLLYLTEKPKQMFWPTQYFPVSLIFGLEKWKLFSRVRLFATPRAIQSMEFSKSEYWSRQPFPSPGDLPNPGIEPRSPALQADSLSAEPQGKSIWVGLSSNSGQLSMGYNEAFHCLVGSLKWQCMTLMHMTFPLPPWKVLLQLVGLGHHTNSVASCPEQPYLHTLFSSVQFSHSVVSDSLRPHGL